MQVDGIVIADEVILCETNRNLNESGTILKALRKSEKAVQTWNLLCKIVLNDYHDLPEDSMKQAYKDIEHFCITEEIAKPPLCIALAGYLTKKSVVELIHGMIIAKFPEIRDLPLLFVEFGERRCITAEEARATPVRF